VESLSDKRNSVNLGLVNLILIMTKDFEIEYDGQYYQVIAEYVISDASFDHAFGIEKRYEVNVSGFKIYSDGAQFIPTDRKFIQNIYLECDRYSKYI
jgi:hypothetical protein